MATSPTIAPRALSRMPRPLYGDRLQLSDVIQVVRGKARLILNVAAASVALTALVLIFLPTYYSASSVVMLEQRRNNVADVSSVLSSLPTDPASVQNQIQILTSRDLASVVIDKLGLETDPEFSRKGPLSIFQPQGGTDPFTAHERVVNAFLNHLSVENEGLSTAISIAFRAHTPEKSAQIANAIAQTYVQSQIEAKFAATKDTTNWLEGRVRGLARQVQAADSAVEQYKAEHNLTESAAGVPLSDQEIGAINNQLLQAKADLAQRQATYARVGTLVRTGHAGDISQATGSPLIIQLRSQEADLIRSEADLATKYGPKHPKLIAVKSQKHDLERKIADEVGRVAGGLANDVSVARAQVASLEGSLSDAEHRGQAQNLLRVKLKSLEVNAVSTHSIYDAFMTRLRNIQDQSGIDAPDARIISHAAVPIAPSSPHRTLILAASIPVGLLLGLLVALMAEHFAPVAPSSARPATGSDLPVLAAVSGLAHPGAADLVLSWPTSPFAKAIRQLASDIVQSAAAGGPRAILLSSAQSGDGAATIAVSLARAASTLGQRVIVLDADIQTPAAAALLGRRPKQEGLGEVLAGHAQLSHCLLKDPQSNVLLLSPSRQPGLSDSAWASEQFRQLMIHLRGSCDLLVICAPPVLGRSGLRSLARHADAVMLVARADAQAGGNAAVAALMRMPSPPIGMVQVS